MSVEEAVLSPATADATVNAENPWPGLLAFRETDHGYFQGRQAETEELLRLALRERLTILFSLSGLGKSSLLQAGLFPRLRQENIFPVYIRLDFSPAKTDQPQAGVAKPDLTAQVIAAIAQQANTHQIEAPTPTAGETLWEYFHRNGNNFWNPRNRPVMPLLVFDQFEETFTLGRLDPERAAGTETFLGELADLAECRTPTRLKEQIDEHPDGASTFNFIRHYYKILLSLREDFLADLDALRTGMPSVALNRMRLRRMNGEAALLVISQAKNLVDSDVAEQVVRFVAADERQLPLTDLELEPALLSVVCRELNNRRRQLNEPKISASLLQGSQEQVLADFYERSTADMTREVRLFIEDHLLTVSGFRDSVALDNALSFPGVTREAIDALVDRRLVRREDRGASQRLELTHDLLVGVIRVSRNFRRQKEAAESVRAAETIKRRRMLRIVIAAFVLLATAILVIGRLYVEKARKRQQEEASRSISDARAHAAYQISVADEKAKQAVLASQFIAQGLVDANAGNYDAALAQFQQAGKSDSGLPLQVLDRAIADAGNKHDKALITKLTIFKQRYLASQGTPRGLGGCADGSSPSNEFHNEPAPNGSWDWNCDGQIERKWHACEDLTPQQCKPNTNATGAPPGFCTEIRAPSGCTPKVAECGQPGWIYPCFYNPADGRCHAGGYEATKTMACR